MSDRPALSPLQKRSSRHWAMLAFLVAVWGVNFALIKVATQTISPPWVATLRMALGAAVVLGVMLARGERLPLDRRSWLWYAWFGIVGTAIPFQIITWGTSKIDSGLAGIMMAGVPLFTIVLAPFFLPDERLTTAKTLGFMAGFVGVAVLIGPTALATMAGSGVELLAQLAIVTGSLCFALFNVTGRLAPPGSALARAAGALLAAALVSGPYTLITDPYGILNPSLTSAAAMAFLGVMSTGLMTVVLFRLLVDAGAGFTSMASYLVPMTAAGIGIVFLGEDLGASAFIGLVLVLSGLWIAERMGRRGS